MSNKNLKERSRKRINGCHSHTHTLPISVRLPFLTTTTTASPTTSLVEIVLLPPLPPLLLLRLRQRRGDACIVGPNRNLFTSFRRKIGATIDGLLSS